MKNAVKKPLDLENDEGVANQAAVLGTDGGPAASANATELTVLEDDFDEDWFDEELTEEELAALDDEDFDAVLAEDFDDLAEDLSSDQDFDTGDLDDLDGDDDFEVLEMLSGKGQHENTGTGHKEEIGDDLFADFDAAEPINADKAEEDSQSFSGDFESANSSTDRFESDDLDIDFEPDSEFSVDEGFEEAEEKSNGSTDIVKVAKADIEKRKKGKVASSEDFDPEKVEPEFASEPDDDMDLLEEEDAKFHRPVPRITIHAFCETSRNSSILEKAAVDRRLSKAHFTMHMGGVEKAVDLYQSSPTPNLIVLETLASGMQLIQQLGQLAEVCDPSTKVIIIGQVNDIRLYRELIRQGVSEYICRPKSPIQIIKTISELYVDPSAPPIGKTIAFVGTRGGVGSSSICHNVGWSFAEEYKSDTIILDLDLPFGTASLDFDHEPTSGLIEALTSPERLDDVLLERLLQKHTDRLSLFTAPNMLDRDYEIEDDAFETVIDVVKSSAPTVVIDVPHNWTGWSKKVLQSADEIVITATPDFASFRNMKYLIEIIGQARPNDSKPYFVYNQFDPKNSAVPVEYFVENIELEPSLILGWEPQLFNLAATNAVPLMEVGEKSKVAQGLHELAGKILGRNEPLALPSRFSLTSLFKRK